MPKLGLGINLANAIGGNAPLTLYQDNFINEGAGDYSFTTRQFFAYPSTASVITTSGLLGQNLSSQSGQLVVAFEAAKDKYPQYSGRAYTIGEEIYGGVYGHAIFRKTGPGAGGGSGGFPPIMRVDSPGGSVAGLEDVNGWTRIVPPTRVLQDGETLKVSFNYKATTTTTANFLRFGVFNISPLVNGGITYPAVNNDYIAGQPTYLNQGTASTIYNSASGYAFMFGKNVSYGGIYRRIPNSSNSLIGTTGSVYTQLQSGTASSVLVTGTYYSITIRIKREGSSLRVTSILPNARITTVDTSPNSYSFNSFVAYAVSGTTQYVLQPIKVEFGTIPDPYINQIDIFNGSFSQANGTYTRSSSSDNSFTKITGTTPGSIFFSAGVWYIFSSAIGNVAQNTSELGTGTWTPLAPGNSSGITSVYTYTS